MSYFSYGAPAGSVDPNQGFVISYIFTESMDDVPVMSDDGTEYLYTERTISITGVLNANLQPALISGAETPSSTLARIRHTLETPRLQLFYFHNNSADLDPLCQSPAAGQFTDAKLGPYPKHVKLTQIRGSESLHVELVYVTYVLDCSGNLPYISHRWTEQSIIDENFLTTKTRTGKIYVRAESGISPDSLRGLVAPPIYPGFKRVKSEYVLQSDGLALMYTFTDVEQFIQPPIGSTKAEGEYIESTSDGGARFAECRVRLAGPKIGLFSDRASLIQTAIQIAVQKLGLGGAVGFLEGSWLLIGAVKEALWKNEVEVQLKAIIEPKPTSRTKGVAVDLSRFNAPMFGVDYQTQLPTDLGTAGSAQLGLIANALSDPCLVVYVIQNGRQSTLTSGAALPPQAGQSTMTSGTGLPSQPSVPAGTTPAVIKTGQLPPDQTSKFKTIPGLGGGDGSGGAFAHYKMTIHYDFDDQTVVMATAKSGAPAAAVQLGQGTLGLSIDWSAERYNDWPLVPQLYIQDNNIVFLRGSIDLQQVDVAGDGVTPIYRLAGSYTYMCLDRNMTRLLAPVPPYLDDGFTSSVTLVPETIFVPLTSMKQGKNSALTSSAPAQQPAAPF